MRTDRPTRRRSPLTHRSQLVFLTILYGFAVGISLGLTGGGGSIFAVPLLLYGLDLDFRRSVALSLLVVGLTALYGALLQARRNQIIWGAGIILGLGGILAAPLGSAIGSRLSEKASLILFASLMIFIAIRMLQRKRDATEIPISPLACERKPDGTPRFSTTCAAKLIIAGACTGILAGIFGVGGAILIVPALLLVTQISIERALATSLVAIFLISLSGFISNAGQLAPGDWSIAAWFLLGAAIGMTTGVGLKRFLPTQWLGRIFAFTILGTALMILLQTFGGSR